MCDRERLVRGSILARQACGGCDRSTCGCTVKVLGDGPKDRRPARSPAPGIATMYADVVGSPEAIAHAYGLGREEEFINIFGDCE